ncbi:porin family protein [Maribacter halichondriae]|uniref:porin family protein n=1 Tax=Maribacter halichondriae TaxID=2980554 RepID=UPI0023595D88|nr:porin family protein [Maribacter sp. Hal144]
MKKLFPLLLFFLMALPSMNYSQNVVQGTSSLSGGSDIRFGAKAGLVVSDLRGNGIIDNSPHPGFQVGGIVEIPITGDFYLDPELLFSMQGTNNTGDNLHLYYLNVPIMGKYHITEEIAVEAGPQVGILLGGNYDDLLETSTIDIGIGVGGGYRLDENFYFQLRFNTGFIKVIDNINTYNIAVQIGASYFF